MKKLPVKIFDIARLRPLDHEQWSDARRLYELTRDEAFVDGSKDIFDMLK